ncbi:MAG TPA: hypothetical protein VLH39_06940, partial [Magnetospirillaceae bacterium]|nr:hypothetical protein [Magnetospirillaceae bacterium]
MTRIRYILSAAFFTAAALGSTVLAAGCASGGPAVQARLGSPPARPGRGEIYLVPNFRIGWYDTMQRPETPARLAAAGYDTVMPYIGLRSKEVVRTFLDAAEKAGIGVHLDIPSAPVRDKDGRALEEFILAFRDSPAVLSWYLYDEPEWKPAVRPWVLRRAYKRIKALDPGRPIALVFMFPFLAPPYRG